MRGDLGMSAGTFGFAVGMFYWAYFLLEVPSNVILEESPTERALLRAICQGPRPLPAVLRNSPETPSAMSAARRRLGVFHWRQRAARNRNRTQRVRAINTSGDSQKPK